MTLEKWFLMHLIYVLLFGWLAFRSRKSNNDDSSFMIMLILIAIFHFFAGWLFPEFRIPISF